MSHELAPLARRLAAILESTQDAVITTDLTGVITSWNRGAEEMLGYPAGEAVGQPLGLTVPSDRAVEEQQLLARVARGERVPHWDARRRRRDGSWIDVSVTLSPIVEDSGAIVGVSSIARDITDRKQMEVGLLEAQRRLMALARASASLAGSTDIAHVLTTTLDVAREVFLADGYALWRVGEDATWRIWRAWGVSDAFASRAVASLGPSGPVARVPFDMPLVCEDVSAMPMLESMRDAYAEEGVVSMIIFPLTLDGELGGTFCFYFKSSRGFSDIDKQVGTALANLAAASLTTASLYEQQKRARQAAERSEHQARFIARSSQALNESLDYTQTLANVANLAVPTMADWCAVHIVDDRGRIQNLAVTHADPAKVAWARQLQERYPADPDAPGGIHEAMRNQQPTYMFRIPAEALEAGARDDEHRAIIRKLALTGYICAPLVAYGRSFGAITFVSAESNRIYDDSDVRIAQELARRASLAVENARAYSRATEASRLKDDFLATLSHELRTPLNAVLGYVRLLRMGSLPLDKAEAALATIERNGMTLKQMIEDVLDMSRIVSGRVRLDVQPVALPSLLEGACASIGPAAAAKGIRVETIIEPVNTIVSGDPDRLQQIVWNLLSNAIKFTPSGGTVQLSLARVNSHVEIIVCDTGRGISPEFLPAVFERFRQEDATFSREYDGLGLGLAVAKQLTELHGGTIHAASAGIGQGSTFTVRLPLMLAHGTQSKLTRVQPTSKSVTRPLQNVTCLDGVHVLAVDDQPDSLSLVKQILEGVGARVRTARSSAEALDLLAETPDVLIADLGMPGMDGHELIRQIRQLPGAAGKMPAAALTAYARPQDRMASLKHGYQLHLVKPIDPLELIAAVARLAAG